MRGDLGERAVARRSEENNDVAAKRGAPRNDASLGVPANDQSKVALLNLWKGFHLLARRDPDPFERVQECPRCDLS
jgi:hypothetical protein